MPKACAGWQRPRTPMALRLTILAAHMEPTPKKQRILSGVQPSGKLHLGNYFGAIKQHIELQEQGDCFYFIANYHAQTTMRDLAERMSVEQSRKLKAADLLRQHTLDV